MKIWALAFVVFTLTVGPSNASTRQDCTASLTFDTFSVLTDTDEKPPYPKPDRWTIHVYSRVNDTPGKVSPTKDGGVVGDTGASRAFETQMITNQVVGELGGPVQFRIRGGPIASRIKERDGDGVYPRDIGFFSLDDTIRCVPGVYIYRLEVSVPANPGGAAGEHDGLIGLRFTLTLGFSGRSLPGEAVSR